MTINKTHKLILLILGLCIIVMIGLNACSSNDKFHSLRVKLAKIKLAREKQSRKFSEAEVKLPAPVTYGFSNYSATHLGNGTVNKMISPLQAYPLSQLKFIGTISQNDELFAYIETPDGKTFSVKKGDFIGDQCGKITKIDPTRVEVLAKELLKGNRSVDKIILIPLKE